MNVNLCTSQLFSTTIALLNAIGFVCCFSLLTHLPRWFSQRNHVGHDSPASFPYTSMFSTEALESSGQSISHLLCIHVKLQVTNCTSPHRSLSGPLRHSSTHPTNSNAHLPAGPCQLCDWALRLVRFLPTRHHVMLCTGVRAVDMGSGSSRSLFIGVIMSE